MESLYRKYRPLTFESVVGQQHIVSTLEHAVTEGRLSHAYLFCGPRGTGKTTMARILAKALLCSRAEAARAEGASGCMPCGACPECEAIAEGGHPDVYELDAASRTGVDNVREEIINSVNFAPVRGAYKIYIIDEVHMLTTAAFNALLKTLEEPPAHVVFVLCTTDPQKLPETILSRCQRFDFHRIAGDDIVGRMRFICEQEGFAFDDDALEIVAKHARGGMRDALSTLEQLSVFGDGAVRAADARALLGEVASTVLSEFSCKIAVRDTPGLFALVRTQVDEGNDLLELTRDLVAHMRDVYTAAIAGPRAELFDGTPEEVQAFVEEARLFEGADRLARTLTVLDDAALEMRTASDPRLVLEIACTRLARPETDLTLEALSERIARLETQLAAGVPSGPMDKDKLFASAHEAKGSVPAAVPSAVTAPSAATATKTAVAEKAVQKSQNSGELESFSTSAPKSEERDASSAPSASVSVPAAVTPGPSSAPKPVAATVAADAQPDMAACAITPPAADASDLQRRWAEAVKRITAIQPSRGGLLQSSRAVSDDGETLTVAFPKGSSFAMKMITRPDSHELVMPVICQVFGKRAVTYTMDGAASAAVQAPAATPAPAAAPVSATPPTPPAEPVAPVPSATPVAQRPDAAPAAPAPTAPAPSLPNAEAQVDQASGPTVVPEPDVEADRAAWEADLPPYDDAFVVSYEDDPEIPPFDVSAPAEPAPAEPAPAAKTGSDSQLADRKPADPQSTAAPSVEPSPATSQVAEPVADAPVVSDEDAKALLNGIWGNVVIKPAE